MNDKIKLKDACKILNGFAFKNGKYVDSGIRIIRIANVQKGYVEDERPVFYPNSEESSIRDYMLEEDDLLLSLTGNVGRVALLDKRWLPAALNQRVACLRIKDDRIIKDYLYFALLSDKFENDCIESSKGIAQKNMSTEWLKDYEIPLPSGQKQREIVSSLEQLSMIIKNKTEQIQQLDDLVKARFVEMFGDPSKGDKIKTDKRKIGEIATVTKLAGFEFTKYINYQEEGDIIMLRGLNCKNGHLVLDNIKWIDQAVSDALPRSKLYKGDILMTYAGTIGDVAMVDKDNTYHLAPNVGKISINNTNEINPVFLTQLFLNTHDYIMSFASQVAQASINMQKIRDFDYYFPPIELQNQFANFVTQVDKSKFAVQKSLEKTQLLFDSLMQEYFG